MYSDKPVFTFGIPASLWNDAQDMRFTPLVAHLHEQAKPWPECPQIGEFVNVMRQSDGRKTLGEVVGLHAILGIKTRVYQYHLIVKVSRIEWKGELDAPSDVLNLRRPGPGVSGQHPEQKQAVMQFLSKFFWMGDRS